MTDLHDLLERADRALSESIPTTDDGLHDLDRRRDRRTRDRRIRAGALGVIVALATGLVLARSLTSDPVPADPPSEEAATYSSALHEVTIGYPAGWKVRPATEPWSGGRLTFDASDVDVIFDPTLGDDLYLALVSRPLGSASSEDWVWNNSMRQGVCAETTSAASSEIRWDGPGRYTYWVVRCHGGGSPAGGRYLRVATDTRGYLIYLHVSDRLWDTYDDPFFNGLLETLYLEYRDPVEPSPSE